jgi:hypothetical protein
MLENMLKPISNIKYLNYDVFGFYDFHLLSALMNSSSQIIEIFGMIDFKKSKVKTDVMIFLLSFQVYPSLNATPSPKSLLMLAMYTVFFGNMKIF